MNREIHRFSTNSFFFTTEGNNDINYESVNLFLAIIEKKLYRCEFVDNDGNSKMMLFVFLDSMIDVTSDFSIVVRLIQSDYDLPFLFREPFVYDCSIISLYRMKII